LAPTRSVGQPERLSVKAHEALRHPFSCHKQASAQFHPQQITAKLDGHRFDLSANSHAQGYVDNPTPTRAALAWLGFSIADLIFSKRFSVSADTSCLSGAFGAPVSGRKNPVPGGNSRKGGRPTQLESKSLARRAASALHARDRHSAINWRRPGRRQRSPPPPRAPSRTVVPAVPRSELAPSGRSAWIDVRVDRITRFSTAEIPRSPVV